MSLRSKTFVVVGLAAVLWACELVTNSGDFATVAPDGGFGCPLSQTTCTSDAGAISCANIETDNANCGGCGQPCAAGMVCSGGTCQANCSPGETTCQEGCFDLTSDRENCGTCGNACAKSDVCSASQCAVGCGASLKLCDGTCVTEAQGTECGVCANNQVCATGYKCTLGFCVVTNGCKSVCGGQCVDPLTDSKNCGACGHACPGDGACVNGTCTTCAVGYEFCTDKCIDVTNDAANCGGCGTACKAGMFCVGALKGCAACPTLGLESPTVCNNECVYTASDPSNCGGCGIRCKGSCIAGKCSS